MPTSSQTSRLMTAMRTGDASAAEALLPIVYDHLHAVATRHFRHQPRAHTLQPTALVHECFIRLIDRTDATYADEAHFCAVASLAMRQILVNHARRRRTERRGGDRRRVPLDAALELADDDRSDEQVLALDDVLTRLAERDERLARVVEMRFFGGMSNEQVARVLDVGVSTVERDWRLARAWLSRALEA